MKLLATTEEIITAYNSTKEVLTSKNQYCVINNNYDDIIISNAPSGLYNNLSIRKYFAPKELNKAQINFIPLLLQNIDDFHQNAENFKLNGCFNNSVKVFDFLSQINIKDFGISAPVKLVYGYIVRKIPAGTALGDVVIGVGIAIHDWHVWNYIDNLLVDMSLLKLGPVVDVSAEVAWLGASDFSCIYPPQNTEYFGLEFDNYEEFEKSYRLIFNC